MGFSVASAVNCIGANWGTQATHPLELSTTVKLLKDNGFQKVKLFDADSITLTALKGSGLEVMVGIPNEMLYSLANSVPAAVNWVGKNVSAHISSNSVNMRAVRAMSETLKHDRLLCQQGSNSFYPHSLAVNNSGEDLQKSVCVFALLFYQLLMIPILGCTFSVGPYDHSRG
ncbi:hypothetical protein AgCh_012276 [Apium graveolens]